MRKIISIFLILCFIQTTAFAVDFDDSIDANIRNEYNLDDNNLPKLPSSVPTATVDIPKLPTYNPTGKTYKLISGTKVKLISNSSISDKFAQGIKINLSAQEGFVTQEGTIIPAGTIFKGTITDAHKPQITGNGGLIELNVNEIYFNGIASPIKTKICVANEKRIFLGNIKGKRTYFKNIAKSMQPGIKFYNGTQKVASSMNKVPVINFVSFIPVLLGGAVYGVNLVASPFISIFKKGESISIPSGSVFEIKILGENEIKG